MTHMPKHARYSDVLSLRTQSALRRIASMGPKARASIETVLGATEYLGQSDLTEEQRRHLVMLADDNAVLVHILSTVLDLVEEKDGGFDPSPDVSEGRRLAALIAGGRATA